MQTKLVFRGSTGIRNTRWITRQWFGVFWLLPTLIGSFLFAEIQVRPVRAASCDPAPTGIIGWWPGNGDATDLIGGNNGALEGGATATAAGMVGEAFSFDGTNGYVQIPDAPALKPANFTVEAWARFSSLNSAGSGGSPAGTQYIVFKQNSRSGNFEGIDLSKTRTAEGDCFKFLVTSASAQSVSINSTTTITTGVWYHVAAVRGSNFLQLYVNGQLQGQTNVTFAQDYGTLPLYFGTTGESSWDHKFAGNLDEVTLYNRPLASNEIAAIYAAGPAGKCEPTGGAVITGQPQSQTVPAGGNAFFEVTAGGSQPLSYQWQFNGTIITGGTSPTLTLTNVQSAQEGGYSVVVSNSLAAATSSVAALVVVPPGAITIDGANKYQVIDGFGVNANSHSWTNNELQPVLDALIDQAGMSLFQAIIINSNWEMTNGDSDPNVMNWNYYDTIYTNADFQKLWGMMAYLNQRGISNGLIPKVGGPGPLWMGGLSLKAGDENYYARMIASLVIYARTNQQLKFNELRPVNETDITYSGVNMSGSAQDVTVLHDLALQLNNNGMSDVRYSGPDMAILSTSWMAAMMNDPLVMGKVAHFGAHFYQTGGGDPTAMSSFIQQSAYPDTPWWATECGVWCSSCNDGVSGDGSWAYAQGTASWLLYLLGEGASACIVFEAYDSQYYGYNAQTGQNTPATWSFWGLMAVDNINATPRTYTPRKQFYTFAQIAKFVRPGAQRINVSASPSGVTMLAFYNTNNGQFTVTGVNSNTTTTSLSCVLTSLPAIPSLDLYYTTSATNLAQGAPVGVTNGIFSVAIPANSVFTLTHSNAASIFLTPLMQNGNFGLTLSGPAGFTYQLQASTNLANWVVLTNVVNSNGTIGFTDTNMPAFSARFYRAMLSN
ncbi:MAG TPA: LamG-like jellyroll fold domain-containing protein [Candidatus Acidoferrales bacterium]|jgi:O-glycosyl hydrolase|nr:LamG-like jellyroll fold domain-containing protein [Candidatus Acidoferrales bacterium]